MPTRRKKPPVQDFYIYLISDATGTTLQGLARACLAQFEDIHPIERFWPLIRSEAQLNRAIEDIRENPGPVLFTLVERKLRKQLERVCTELQIPCMPVLDPILRNLSGYLGLPPKGVPGLQHALDEAYFRRIDAVDFALSYDDGQHLEGIEDADVILTGVSRTSKTPTCIFLARRGIKAANIPLVPGVPFPQKLLNVKGPLLIGLTEQADRLVHVRRNRLHTDGMNPQYNENSYLDPEKVEEEVRNARRLFSKQGWPVIDVTRRSIEETAAEIMILLEKHRRKKEKAEREGETKS